MQVFDDVLEKSIEYFNTLFTATKLKSSSLSKSQLCYIPEHRVSLGVNSQGVSWPNGYSVTDGTELHIKHSKVWTELNYSASFNQDV